MMRIIDWFSDMPGWAVLLLFACYIGIGVVLTPPQMRCIGLQVEVTE